MFDVLTLNDISQKGLNKLNKRDFTISSTTENPDAILLRSASMHDMALNKNLLAISRAGAGTNNIPIQNCTDAGIVVFNTPGANANAVKELVITALLLSSRKVIDGIEWAKTLEGNIPELVEKGKNQFSGPELYGKTLSVIGLGAIGVLVANVATSLGLRVIGYDPYLSVISALHIKTNVIIAETLDEALSESDYISIHVPYNQKTKHLFNDETFAKVKPNCKLLNFARAELVDNNALKNAIEQHIISTYITDFPTEDILNFKNVIAIPHLGASTPESEENCAEMAATELSQFLKYGIIKNSVNFPSCDSAYSGKTRITLIHKNIPKMVGSITNILANEDINIDNMVNKSKGDIAYTIVDIDSKDAHTLIPQLENISGMIKVRLI
ncbi:MAG: 3-phosphoglycerate dehydrogenase [Epulopiscium sp. Nuni2H_MBin003]|nr:MAG: 3-phosphoglycerate dehydrogenase [Epulopiscium sp. Nuni2H_MBin003]